MKSLFLQLDKFEFEWRMFISLSLVLTVCMAIAALTPAAVPVSVLLGAFFGGAPGASKAAGFLISARIMEVATVLRMWAGSSLSSSRVMAFRVQTDALHQEGPYAVVRNPIYLADLIAMTGFALSLPPLGLLIPILLYVHYIRLIRFEELSLGSRYGEAYHLYCGRVNRLIPGPRGFAAAFRKLRHFRLTKDGIRSNGLYALFSVGFMVAAWTGEFFHAVIIGLPALLDWGIIHTTKGLQGAAPRTPKVFQDLLYAQCWEDPQSDRVALKIRSGDVVFSICSGGCNTLTFLLDDPRRVYSLDLNPAQVHLLELKMAAFRRLPYDQMLTFLGYRETSRRMALYGLLAPDLSPAARAYWDGQSRKIDLGVIHSGRYERYMRLIRRWVRWVQGARTVDRLFELRGALERERFYQEEWNTIRWRVLTKALLSRRLMTLLFDAAFFNYLESSFSFGEHFASKVQHALTRLPLANPYLSYILLGRHDSEESLPLYVRKASFEIIRKRLERVVPVVSSCEQFFPTLEESGIDRFNFSNIFEWMSQQAFTDILRQAVRVGTDGARLVYRNLLVRRERPDVLAGVIAREQELAASILGRDHSFIYNNYVVERISKGGRTWDYRSSRSKAARPVGIS